MKIKTPTSIVSPTSGAEKVVVERSHRQSAMDLRRLNDLIAEIQRFPHAIGEPVPLMIDACPDKCLPLEGGSFSKTTYPMLNAVYGYMYGGSGDNFTVPDMRGLVPRGWNHGKANGIYDVDANSRLDRGDGTVGDAVGTYQGDQLRSHNHPANYSGHKGGSNTYVYHMYHGTGGWAVGYAGGSETRMANIAVYWVTRYTW